MWARIGEVLLGLWLACGPFVLATTESRAAPAFDLVCGLVVIACAALSWRPGTRRAHLLSLGVAVAIATVGWLDGRSGAASALQQSRMLTALTLVMLAVIPSRAQRPPDGWHETISEEA